MELYVMYPIFILEINFGQILAIEKKNILIVDFFHIAKAELNEVI